MRLPRRPVHPSCRDMQREDRREIKIDGEADKTEKDESQIFF